MEWDMIYMLAISILPPVALAAYLIWDEEYTYRQEREKRQGKG